MTSQIVINIDSQLKELAMIKAKSEGITMKALLGYFLSGYINNDIGIGVKVNNNGKMESNFIKRNH